MSLLRGMTTVSYYADDVAAAREWYTPLLGTEPYFVRPVEGEPLYIEYRIGDFQHELGIVDRRYAPHSVEQGPAGAVLYWAVDNIESAYSALLSHGASAHEAPRHLESGYYLASVIDPFGNVLGVFYNPHYLDVVARMTEVSQPAVG